MIVQVRVSPGKGSIRKTESGLIVQTMERRENNRANLDVMKQIAEYFNVDTSRVRLIKGRTSRNKAFIVDIEENGD